MNIWQLWRYRWNRWRKGPTPHERSLPFILPAGALPLPLNRLSLGVMHALYGV